MLFMVSKVSYIFQRVVRDPNLLPGTAKNHQERQTALHSQVCLEINKKLHKWNDMYYYYN